MYSKREQWEEEKLCNKMPLDILGASHQVMHKLFFVALASEGKKLHLRDKICDLIHNYDHQKLRHWLSKANIWAKLAVCYLY